MLRHRVAVATILLCSFLLLAGCHHTARHRNIVESNIDYILKTSLARKPVKPSTEFKALVAKCNATNGDLNARNDIIFSMLAQIRKYHETNYNDLYMSVAGVETAADLTVLALGAAGAFASQGGSQLLSALSAVVVGARASAQLNYMNDMNKFVVMVRQEKLRHTKRAEIIENMTKPYAQYRLTAAAKGLQALLEDGSIRQAVTNDASEAIKDLATALQRAEAAEAALRALPANP